jgi:DNA polymerase-3 subunit epsilon
MRQVFFDTETTGLSPQDDDRIVEIGAVEVVDGLPSGRLFHCYLDPQRPMPAQACAVHGLTDEFLAGRPRFADVVPPLREFVCGAEVLMHHAPFDLGFLDAELRRGGAAHPFDALCSRVVDTLPVFRRLHPGQACSLDALCLRYAIEPAEDERRHSALGDARLLARLWRALGATGGFVPP